MPEVAVGPSPGAYAELLALETEVSRDPAFRALAPHVHVFAQLPPAQVLSGLSRQPGAVAGVLSALRS